MRFPWDYKLMDKVASIEDCLEDLNEEMDPNSLEYYFDCIYAHLRNDGAISERLFSLFEDPNYPAKNRGAAIGLLTTYFGERKDNPGMSRLADSLMGGIRKYHDENKSLDGYVDGGTIALRILSIPEEKRDVLADLMRLQVKRIQDHYGLADNGNRSVFKDSLLVLGSYGDPKDISLVLDFIEKDKDTSGEYIDPAQKIMNVQNGKLSFSDSPLIIRNNPLMSHTLEGLRRLLIRHADKIDDGNSKEVRRICGGLLEGSVNNGNTDDDFHYSGCILRALSSRLDPLDLDIGVRYSEFSKERTGGTSLAYSMLESIKDNKKDLAIAGQEKWLKEKEPYANEICEKLSGILANN